MRLFVGEIAGEEGEGCDMPQRGVRPLRIVPDEPVHQRAVEGRKVVRQKMRVRRDEVLLNGAVEAFDDGIHLGSAGIRMELLDTGGRDVVPEVFCELRAVVGLDTGERKGKHRFNFLKQITCVPRRGALQDFVGIRI